MNKIKTYLRERRIARYLRELEERAIARKRLDNSMRAWGEGIQNRIASKQ